MGHGLLVVRPKGGQGGPFRPERLAETRHVAMPEDRPNPGKQRQPPAVDFDPLRGEVANQGLRHR